MLNSLVFKFVERKQKHDAVKNVLVLEKVLIVPGKRTQVFRGFFGSE